MTHARPSDRAVSTVVGYVLTLGISSLLVIGLLVGTGGFVSDQRTETVHDELRVIGQQIATDLASADTLVLAGGEEVRIARNLPSDVTGVPYRIEISPGAPTTVRLTTEDPAVSVAVTVRTTTDVGPAGGVTLAGGDLVVEYDTGTSQLEVHDD